MSGPLPIISLVTLGVSDLARSIAFYEALGFLRKARNAEGVGFFQAGACAFAVWPAADLAKDSNMWLATPAFRGLALAWNCRTEAQVDSVMARAQEAGGTLQKPARKTFWAAMPATSSTPTGISGKSRTIRDFRSPTTGG